MTHPVKKVTLTRVSSVTHHFDSDQRFIELDHTGGTQGGTTSTLTVTAPREDRAPQGYYLPSISRIVQFL